MDKLDMKSPDFTDQNIEKLAALFPNCVTEAKDKNGKLQKAIDFDLLKQELSNNIIDGPRERYQLNWPGKREALLTANTPITKTLRPCREESVDFDTTENLFIEGDNLDALKLLQETYLGKVKMIYIDPPYNTGKDFVYSDNFTVDKDDYDELSEQKDEDGGRLVANPDSNGRFHSDWLDMMYPRLKLARNLLRDDGVIFISIDDNEQANLKRVCDEVFGIDNFLGCAGRVTKKSNNKGDFWAPNLDYVLTYASSVKNTVKFFGGVNYDAYNLVDKEGKRKGEKYQLVRMYMSSLQNRNPEQRFYIECPDGSKVIPPGTTFPPERPNLGDGIWRWTRKKMEKDADSIVVKSVKSSNLITEIGEPAKWNVFTKTYLSDVIANASAKPNSLIEDHINQIGSHEISALGIPFDFSKPSTLVKYLLEVSRSDSDSVILDFFAGSSTTAHAVMQLNAEDGGNRKFIMVQLPEETDEKSEAFKAGYATIAEISKERIRRAGKKIKETLTQESKNKPQNTKNTQKSEKQDPSACSVPSVVEKELDIGFRVLKVDSSNMKDVYYAPDQITQGDLIDQADNIKEDRGAEDLLFQVLLDWGVDLSLPISRETFTTEDTEQHGKKTKEFEVFFVDGSYDSPALCACFDKDINENLVKQIAKREPLRAVFRDAGYGSDSTKINIKQIFKLVSPQTEVKAI